MRGWSRTRRCPAREPGRFSRARPVAGPGDRPVPRADSDEFGELGAPSIVEPAVSVPCRGDPESEPPRFIVEELLPYSQPERTAANLPLSLDDPEAVWWVSSGGVDVFFTQFEPGAPQGRRRHLCRVEEGGSIFAISGVRGRSGGGLLAVGAGPAQLLKFARGDLIRLSFEEGLSEQVAVLIDDWLLRVGRALGRLAGIHGHRGARVGHAARLRARRPLRRPRGVAWVRHLSGTSSFLDQVPLPVTELEARFPVTEHLWLTAATACRVTACDTTTMIRTGDPWAGLDDFHRTILDFISGIDEQESRAGWAEFQRSIAHEAALVESVSSQLAAAATGSPSISAVDPGGDALVTACRTRGTSPGHRGPCLRRRAATAGSGRLERPAGRPGASLRLSRAAGHAAAGLVAPRGGEPLLGQLARPRSTRPWPWCRRSRRRAGPGPPTSCSIPKAGAGPSTSELAGRLRSHSLDVLPDAPRRAAAEASTCPLQPEPAGPGARALDGVRHGPPRSDARLVDPDRLRHPRRPGHPGGRSRPRLAVMCLFLVVLTSRPRFSRRSRGCWSCASRAGSRRP